MFFTPKQITAVLTCLGGGERKAFQGCGEIRIEPQGHCGLEWVSVPRAVKVKRGHILLRLQWRVAGLGGGLEGWEKEVLTGASLSFVFITECPEPVCLL